MLHRSYEYMDGEMLKNCIALIRLHQEFGYIVWSARLIKDKKLIEEVQKKSLNWHLNWRRYHMKRDWVGSSCLVCIIIKPMEIWLKSIDVYMVYTLQISNYYPLIKEDMIWTISSYHKGIWTKILQDNQLTKFF